jgi:hypothetical protein
MADLEYQRYLQKEFAKQRAKEALEKVIEQEKNKEKSAELRKNLIESLRLKKLIITLKVRGAVKYDIPEFLPSYIENSNQDYNNKIYFDVSNNLNFKKIKNFFKTTKYNFYNINDSKILFTNVKLYEIYLKKLENINKNIYINNIKKNILELITNINNLKKNIIPTVSNIISEIDYIPDKLNELEKMLINLQMKIIEIINKKLIENPISNVSSKSIEDEGKREVSSKVRLGGDIIGGQKTYEMASIKSFELKVIYLQKNINYLNSLIIINNILVPPFNEKYEMYESIKILLDISNKEKLLLDKINTKEKYILREKLTEKNLNINTIKNILTNKKYIYEQIPINYKEWRETDKNENETINIDIINDDIIKDDIIKDDKENIDNINIVVDKKKITKEEYNITLNNIDYILKSFFNSENKFNFYNKKYLIHSYLWDEKYNLTTKSNCKVLVTLYVYEEDKIKDEDKKNIFNNKLSCNIKKNKLYNDFLNLVGYKSGIEKEDLKYRIQRKPKKSKKKIRPQKYYRIDSIRNFDPYYNRYYSRYNRNPYGRIRGGSKNINKSKTKRIYYKSKIKKIYTNKIKRKYNYNKNYNKKSKTKKNR